MVDRGFGSGSPALLDGALAAMIGVAALLSAATFVRFYLMMTLGERVVTDLRRTVFNHILALEPGYFEATRTGEVIARLTNDAATQSRTTPGNAEVQWARGGAAPEVGRVIFELSTDGGAN